jgi:uncharacterized protein (DUF433 family)
MEYVEQRNGAYYVAGTRVSLDSVVCAYLKGKTTEGIQDSYSALNQEQIFGALAYYLHNRPLIDEYLRRQQAEFDRMRAEDRARRPEFYARMEAARRTLAEKQELTSEAK